MDMNIQKYMAFIKTADCGSFSKAGEILNYSQSAISRMIKDLENEWKLSLLERGKGGVKLTSDGLNLYPYVKNVCQVYENLQIQIDNINGLESGTIRIGTFSSVATHWLPNIIKKFQNDYPNINYELLLGDYDEIEKWIEEGRVDCGFLMLPAKKEFETIFLENDSLMAVLPVNHPMTECDNFPVKELDNAPFMLLEKDYKTEISKILDDNGVKPNICFKTWDDYAIMSMVESGMGISILPKLILKRVPYKIVAKELDVKAYRRIGLAVRDKKTVPLAVKKFIDYLKYR